MYSNEAMLNGFQWLKNEEDVMDYGCGIGQTINKFLYINNNYKGNISGVDISDKAIEKVSNIYADRGYNFYCITENNIPQIRNNSLSSIYLVNVLHHVPPEQHKEILVELHSKLKKNGKFLLIDLTYTNIIINIGLKIFLYMPSFIKNSFKDDLYSDNSLPEKFVVDFDHIVNILKMLDYKIKDIERYHLFAFVIDWIGGVLKLKNFKPYQMLFKSIIKFEKMLLKFSFFRKRAHIFMVKVVK